MTLLNMLSKEQQSTIVKMADDLIELDNRMLESLKRIQGKYEWHKDFVEEFKKGNRTVEQFQEFLKKDTEKPSL